MAPSTGTLRWFQFEKFRGYTLLVYQRLAGGAVKHFHLLKPRYSARLEICFPVVCTAAAAAGERLVKSESVRRPLALVSILGAASSMLWVWRQRSHLTLSCGSMIKAEHNSKIQMEDVGIGEVTANQHMEDRHFVQYMPEGMLALAVFDGHGGAQVADWLTYALPQALKQSLSKAPGDTICQVATNALKEAFCWCDASLANSLALAMEKDRAFSSLITVGACAVCVLLDAKFYHVASAGDCRVVLVSSGKAATVSDVHSADEPVEQARLRKAHPNEQDLILCRGRFGMAQAPPCYVKGLLQPTRSFGDLYLKENRFSNRQDGKSLVSQPSSPPYITAEPELKSVERSPNDEFLILSSDGLFDYLSHEQVAAICKECKEQATPKELAQTLVDEALRQAAMAHRMDEVTLLKMAVGRRRRRYHDDMTVVVVRLKEPKAS